MNGPPQQIGLAFNAQFFTNGQTMGFNRFQTEIQGQGDARGGISVDQVTEDFLFAGREIFNGARS